MEDVLEEFELAQVEEAADQHAILESIQDEMEVAMNRHFIHEADVKREQLFVDEEGEDEVPDFCPTAND